MKVMDFFIKCINLFHAHPVTKFYKQGGIKRRIRAKAGVAIAEEYLSSRWLINRFRNLSGIEVATLVEMNQFHQEPSHRQTFDEFAQNLSDFIIEIIREENPEVVLIGGHMETSKRFFFSKLTENIKAKNIKTHILSAFLGEKAMVLGAASTWYDSSRPLHK